MVTVRVDTIKPCSHCGRHPRELHEPTCVMNVLLAGTGPTTQDQRQACLEAHPQNTHTDGYCQGTMT